MAKTKAFNNHLRFNSVNYFTAGADVIELGGYGEKLTPLVGANRLNQKGVLPAPKLSEHKVRASMVAIDQEQVHDNAFDTLVKVIIKGVPVKLTGSDIRRQVKQQELKLVHFHVLPNDLKQAVNESPKVLTNLAGYGGDARVVSDIFVAMDAKTAQSFESQTNVELKAGSGPMSASVGNAHGAQGTITVQLLNEATYAYMLQKIDWNKGKTRVDDLDPDPWG